MKQFFKFTLASILGLFVFSIFSFLIFMGVLGSIAAMNETKTVLKPNSVYVVEMEGTLVERSEDDPFSEAMSEAMGYEVEKTIGLDDLLENIQKAKNDQNIIGIYLKGGNLSAGYASLKEIRDALIDFRETGKFIVAYADTYTQSNYYLASVADKVFLNTTGMINWRGLNADLEFYKNILEKIGVEMQVVKVGTFKSAVEPYINTKMSDANRLQLEAYLGSVWKNIVAEVATSRQLTSEQLNSYADEMMLLQPVEKYINYHFVDSLLYKIQVDNELKTLAQLDTIADLNFVGTKALCNYTPEKKFQKDKVAVIYAFGEIKEDSGDGINAEKLVTTICSVAKDKAVKSVVLRVNSPGGSAFASEQIWNALVELKKEKPLIVSMGNYAASGGYYISCMADSIVAQPTTLTGSIGIFGLVPNVSGVMNKIGITFDHVQTNKMSSMESNMVLRGMNAEEYDLMQGMVNRGYELFVKRCADGRGMSVDEIKAIAEGRVWTGEAAIENGLVDKLGGLDDAIAIAAEKANLTAYRVVDYPAKKDFMTRMMETINMQTLTDQIAKNQLGENYELLKRVQTATQLKGIQALMPYIAIY